MKINLKVRWSKRLKKGFPIIVDIFDNGKRKYLSFGYFTEKNDWDTNKNVPLPSHPDYDFLFPAIIEIKKKIKEIAYENITDYNRIKTLLQGKPVNRYVSFSDFGRQLIEEKKSRELYKNAEIYQTAISDFEKYLGCKITFRDIEYKKLTDYKNKKLMTVRNSTIHNYLRTLRAIYNEAVRRNITDDIQPFRGVFAGLSIRNSMQRKKYIDKNDIAKLENADLSGVSDFIRDLFLLQFYFGGQDLKDIYYLRKDQINDDRAYFERAKLAGRGYVFDLKIFDKTRRILKKYTGTDGYIFPGRKDHTGYNTFYRRYLRYLHDIQTKLDIKVLPLGGKLGAKVSRHTFANIGKRLFIEEDILRELMGHERNDIDNYYKDKYPADVRDAAHWKIIDTTNLM